MPSQPWARRDFLRRSMALGVAAVAAPAALSACTSVNTGPGGTLENARSAGTIKIGIANEAPYGFTDPSGKVTGESVEVGRAVLKNLGIGDVQATVVDFGSLIAGLNAKQFDMVTAGMFINPERCANAAFSDPDYTAPTAFLVPKGNPKGITSFDDVVANNLRIAVLSGAVEQGYAEKSGVPAAQIQVVDTQNTLLQAVTAGRADAGGAHQHLPQRRGREEPPARRSRSPPASSPTIDGKETISAGAFVFRKDDAPARGGVQRRAEEAARQR